MAVLIVVIGILLFSMNKTRNELEKVEAEKEEIQAIRYVATGAEIPVSTSWVHSDYPTMAFADIGEDPVLPDGVDTVIDVILKK